MIKIFVTGGIGSGKSTLMHFFEAKGAGVVYADEVGHENLHDPAMKEELSESFRCLDFRRGRRSRSL